MADSKTEKTVAEEMREAADRLRIKAADITLAPGPWVVDRYGDSVYSGELEEPDALCVAETTVSAAAWITLVNPLMAEPLASWLEEYARWAKDSIFVEDEGDDPPVHESDYCDGEIGKGCQCFAHPLAVARVLNGSQP